MARGSAAISWRTLGDGPAWSLPTYLILALVLRLPAVLWADGYEFVDQQFQYVDPAWHLATGQAWHPTWEWLDGLRSWVYPGLLAGVFRGLLAVGFENPMSLMRAARAVHAVASLLPVWLFWLCLVRWRPVAAPRLPLLLFAGAGLLVAVGTQPSGPALGATLSVAAALAMHGPRWWPSFAGLCLGFAFCCRSQDALFGPALFVVLLWQGRRSAAGWFVLGCLPGVALQGFVDLAVSGRFLASPWAYVSSNIGLGSAEKWRQQPWWFYLAAGVLPALVFVPPWWRVAWRRFAAGASLLPGALAAAVLHLGLHSCIGRKALRFEYGSLVLLVAVVAAGLGTAVCTGRLALWHQRALFFAQGVILAWASFWPGNLGAIHAALLLHGQPGFQGDVLVVDGDATSLGGYYYLRPPIDRVMGTMRQNLSEHLQASPPVAGSYVVAVREPLACEPLARFGELIPVAICAGRFDLRAGERRFVYRWR